MTMLMHQVREVLTVNREMTDKSSWIWLTLEQIRFPLRSEFANEKHSEAKSSTQYNYQRTGQTTFVWPLLSKISFKTQKGNSMIRSSKTPLKC